MVRTPLLLPVLLSVAAVQGQGQGRSSSADNGRLSDSVHYSLSTIAAGTGQTMHHSVGYLLLWKGLPAQLEAPIDSADRRRNLLRNAAAQDSGRYPLQHVRGGVEYPASVDLRGDVLHVLGRSFPFASGDSAPVVMVDVTRPERPVIQGVEWIPTPLPAELFSVTRKSGDTLMSVAPRSTRKPIDVVLERAPRAVAFVGVRTVAAREAIVRVSVASTTPPISAMRFRTASDSLAFVHQQQTRAASAAYAASDFVKALRLYRAAADSGNPIAMQWLGYFHLWGVGIPRDYRESARWYRAAAEKGRPVAQYELASAYHAGRGVRRSTSDAAEWYRRAADAGNAPAQYMLGTLYETGDGVRRDPAQALHWYRQATRTGNNYAPAALARLGIDSATIVDLRNARRNASRARLDSIPISHPAPTGPGTCRVIPSRSDRSRFVSKVYTEPDGRTTTIGVQVDSSGRLTNYSELRGMVVPQLQRDMTPEQRTAAINAAQERSRSFSIVLNFVERQAFILARGGGEPDLTLGVPLADAENHPRLGAPGVRARAILAECGK